VVVSAAPARRAAVFTTGVPALQVKSWQDAQQRDEATNALDSQSERLVHEAIERFEQGHKVLVIAHRLCTIVNADLICVMEQGRIVERGSHQELLELHGRYALLWQQQVQQRKPVPKA